MAAIAATASAAVSGCGFGPGDADSSDANLVVTRDYGQRQLREPILVKPSESDTALRILDRETEITTRYGGNFVHSIDGIAGASEDSRRFDWFFYVNGIESSVGAAEVEVDGGDVIWWDYRDWTSAMRVPAVVGSWPQPFASADGSSSGGAAVDCRGERETCDEVASRLEAAGAEVFEAGSEQSADAPRVLVGPWTEVGDDQAAMLLDGGPAHSGVFARFESGPKGGAILRELDVTGEVVGTATLGAGLVAGVRNGEDPPTWLITGTDDAGVAAAARLLSEKQLDNHYAVTTVMGAESPLPLLR